MKYNFKSSFDHSYKKLSPPEQESADKAIENLKTFFSTDQKTKGLGVKRLKWNFWEIRASIRLRILFVFQDDTISFVIAGNHNDIARYLRSI